MFEFGFLLLQVVDARLQRLFLLDRAAAEQEKTLQARSWSAVTFCSSATFLS